MRIITPAMITLLMLGVIGALVFFYVIKTFFWAAEAPPPQPQVRTVPMAAADIPAGTFITEDHVVSGRLSESKMDRETILSDSAVVGRYAKEDIKQAQPFKTSNLYAPNERPPLELSEGMRAVTLGLGDSTDIVDGLIKPGDYVDVHLSIANNEGDARYRGGFTMTMFKGVKVLGINRMTQRTNMSRGANTVTFELTPMQANILLEAKNHGEIVITYTPEGPGSGGIDVAEADRAYFEEILGLPDPPEEPDPFMTELWMRGNRSMINYEDDRRNDDWNGATPWIETPGWAPPRTGGSGRGGYRGYRGYRGSQMTPPQPSNPESQTQPANQGTAGSQRSGGRSLNRPAA